jgi:hypothetical protein
MELHYPKNHYYSTDKKYPVRIHNPFSGSKGKSLMRFIHVQSLLCLISFSTLGQESIPSMHFWETLKQHCGKAYEGTVAEPVDSGPFVNKKLFMHVRSCQGNRIRIPFMVGDDRSRTWVLTINNGLITLKHDHRHEDGSEDKITQYGGTASNKGLPTLQMFPADQYTGKLLPAAATNLWWISIDEKQFSYNLRRIGSDIVYRINFDLTKPVEIPPAPWGWKE